MLGLCAHAPSWTYMSALPGNIPAGCVEDRSTVNRGAVSHLKYVLRTIAVKPANIEGLAGMRLNHIFCVVAVSHQPARPGCTRHRDSGSMTSSQVPCCRAQVRASLTSCGRESTSREGEHGLSHVRGEYYRPMFVHTGVATRNIAELIGGKLGVPVAAISPDAAVGSFRLAWPFLLDRSVGFSEWSS